MTILFDVFIQKHAGHYKILHENQHCDKEVSIHVWLGPKPRDVTNLPCRHTRPILL